MSNTHGTKANIADVTPESLMDHFQGPGLLKMVMVTMIFHIVVIFGTSIPYMKRSLFGEDVGKLTKEERIEKAVEDATSALRKIATANGLNPQDISDKFAPGGTRSARTAVAAPSGETPGKTSGSAPGASAQDNTAATVPAAETPAGGTAVEPVKPESQIEKDLKKTEQGPKMPGDGAKDDIF